jgi:hypothetical protein
LHRQLRRQLDDLTSTRIRILVDSVRSFVVRPGFGWSMDRYAPLVNQWKALGC